MSIQNSINTVIGSVAGAALAGKHAKEAAAKKEEQGMLAKEQYHEASADLKQLEGQSAEAKAALDKANANVEATKGWNMEGKNSKMLEGKVAKRLTEQQAAQRAFDELSDRIEARNAMLERTEKIMKRTGTWGGAR